MSTDLPSTAVCVFIDSFVESIDFLRALLLLARQSERTFEIPEVAAAINLPDDLALSVLQRLLFAGFAKETQSSCGTRIYQYAPRAQEFHEMVQELIILDNRKPVTLIRLVYARKSTSAQAFADAFRLRKD